MRISFRHEPLQQQLSTPTCAPCNECSTPAKDRALRLTLLATLRADSDSCRDVSGYERRLEAGLPNFVTAVERHLVGLGVASPRRSVREGGVGSDVLDDVARKFYFSSRGRCPATVSVIGAIAAQEAVKACTHVLSPLSQWLIFESLDSLDPSALTAAPADLSDGADEDDVVKVYGMDVARELQGLRAVLVGAGAIGCELLKTLALLNVGSGSSVASGEPATGLGVWQGLHGGGVVVTDMDSIEKSNLNRQLLFRYNLGRVPNQCANHHMCCSLLTANMCSLVCV